MGMLSRLRIRTKLASMVVFAALAVFAIIAVAASLSQSRMQTDRIEQMRVAVDLLYGLAQGLQDEVASGKMTVAEAQAEFRKRGRKMQFNGGQGYPIAYFPDQTILLNGANPQLEGKITGAKDSDGVLIAEAQIAAGKRSPTGSIAPYLYPRPGQTLPVRKMAFARHFAPWDVTMSYGLYIDDIDTDVNALWWRLGLVGLGLILVTGLVSWLIAHDILSALERLKARMQHIAQGSLDRAVEETGRADEIGRMAETLEVLRQTSLTARSLEAEQVAGKARSEQEKRQALIALADRFDASVGQLVGLMASGSSELESTAKSMTGTAEHTNQRAGVVSSAATDASGRVQTVASAAEELSSSISEISRQVAQSAAVTSRAVESARRTDTIVRALSGGAKEIEHVAELISSIAAPDQPAGAQRHHRSRARRRSRPRLCRGGRGGQEPCEPDRGRHQGDRKPHRADPGRHQRGRGRDPGHHRHDRGGLHHCHRDRRGHRGARRGHGGHRPQRHPDRGSHPRGHQEYRRRLYRRQ